MFGSNQESSTSSSSNTNVLSECKPTTSSTANSSGMDIDVFIEGGRGFRTKKKQTDPTCCPVCSITVRETELESHYYLEMDKLNKLSVNRSRKQPATSSSVTIMPQEGTSTAQPEKCWDMFQKVKNNRQSRLKVKNRKRKVDESVCPICEERTTDIIAHVELCLPRCDVDMERCSVDNATMEDSEIDVEGDGEAFEEYEWAGQTRVRASSLLQGGYAAAGVGTSVTNRRASSEDEDLVVDGDDSHVFGPSQYSERDVIVPILDGSMSKEINALRRAIIGTPKKITNGSRSSMSGTCSETQTSNKSNTISKSGKDACVGSSPSTSPASSSSSSKMDNGPSVSGNSIRDLATAETQTNTAKSNSDIKEANILNTVTSKSCDPIIESLKARIRELEVQSSAVRPNDYKCLICMDSYQTPVVSICCWHIHCEECWLHTLGAKKLCPQCNMITSPLDLRRVFM